MIKDLTDSTQLVCRALERDLGLARLDCAWCVGVCGPPAQCIACNGRGYYLVEADAKDFKDSTRSTKDFGSSM